MNVSNLSFISLMEANLRSNKTQASNLPTNNKLVALLLENPSYHGCLTYSNKNPPPIYLQLCKEFSLPIVLPALFIPFLLPNKQPKSLLVFMLQAIFLKSINLWSPLCGWYFINQWWKKLCKIYSFNSIGCMIHLLKIPFIVFIRHYYKYLFWSWFLY